MHEIYLSYRRSDSIAYAGRLREDLSRRFGPDAVFMDLGSIASGDEFPRAIEGAINTSKVVLVIIGPTWATCTGDDGQSRLNQPMDWVRLEIAAALRRQIRVVPILVDGARLPDPAALPEELKPLCYRHACQLTTPRWSYDVKQLIHDIEKDMPRAALFRFLAKARRFRWLAVSLTIALLVGGAILVPPVINQLAWNPLKGLDPRLDYRLFKSRKLAVEFVYPQAELTVDTTHEDEGFIPLLNNHRQVEVVIRRAKLADWVGVRARRDKEKQKLLALGYQPNFEGPHDEANWSNWYILSGSKPDGFEFYYKRWYTSSDIVSIEYDYSQDRLQLYNQIIDDMTFDRFRYW